MASHVRKVFKEIAKIWNVLLVECFEAKRAGAAIVLYLLYNTSRNLFRKLLLTCNYGNDHALSNRESFKAVLVGRTADLKRQNRESSIEVLRNVSANSLAD